MEALFRNNSNLSVYALPVYYILCLAPHWFAVATASGGQPEKWDNSNPRAAGVKEDIKKRLDERAFKTFERAESAHANGFESLPLVFTAVALGNFARLPVADLNSYAMGMLVIRAVYNVAYIRIASSSLSTVRSLIWIGGMSWSLKMLWSSGAALA